MNTTLEYNTEREHLIIPEYGRHIQKMVNHAIEIENREERNKVANSIISVMGNLQPHLRDVPDFQHKLWDQLFIISNFQLDVDCPYPVITKEQIEERPEPLLYPQNFPKYRFYGNNIKRMIDVANSWEDGEEKEGLIFTIANHMKKCFLSWNKDTVEDSVIFQHLEELSGGRIDLRDKGEILTDASNLMKIKKKLGGGKPNKKQSGSQKNYNSNKNNNYRRR